MPLKLQIENGLSTTPQTVTDEKGNTSPITLSSDKVGIGTTSPQGKLDVSEIVLNGNVKTQLSSTGDLSVLKGSGIVFDLSPVGGAQLHLRCQQDGNKIFLEGVSSDGTGHAAEIRITGNRAQSLPVFAVVADITRFLGGVRVTQNFSVDETAHIKKNLTVDGNIVTSGDIRLTNADCAEDFDICETEQADPGTVMVLGDDGKLQQSQHAYDKRVAGVISGAGDYKPGIILDKQDSQDGRKPIALLGKVFCKVDAQYGAIEVGDLLTTAPTPGHAMRAVDPLKAFGTVIGKAIRPLAEGRGLIPILIALQ